MRFLNPAALRRLETGCHKYAGLEEAGGSRRHFSGRRHERLAGNSEPRLCPGVRADARSEGVQVLALHEIVYTFLGSEGSRRA